jgi:hypothetical protein
MDCRRCQEIKIVPWNFYGWFVFAAVFIGAYFAWVWASSRDGDR